MVERIVRNFILAVWLFHFPFKSKSPSPLHLCSASSRSIHLAFRLFHFPFKFKSPSPLHLCSASSRSVHFLVRTSGVTVAPLAARKVDPLVRLIYHSLIGLRHDNTHVLIAKRKRDSPTPNSNILSETRNPINTLAKMPLTVTNSQETHITSAREENMSTSPSKNPKTPIKPGSNPSRLNFQSFDIESSRAHRAKKIIIYGYRP